MIPGTQIVILEEGEAVPEELLKADSDNRMNGGNHAHSGEMSALIIDKPAYSVYLQGGRISFPKKEFELLLLLASNPRKVFKRTEILEKIWGMNYKQKDSRSLDVHIRMLRKKLLDSYITTIRGVGYKLEK
jgi:two-component system alkaline phosphatase synthesis response regulator PhoP